RATMNRNGSKRKAREVRVWTYEQAKKAVPYITAVMRSLRDQRIEAQNRDRLSRRLADRPGRPDRAALLAQAEAARLAREAGDRFEDSMEELVALDVFCIDPIAGQAVIPFLHAKKLAWFVYDLFDEEDHLRQWRYHDDPLETRRPIAEALADPAITV